MLKVFFGIILVVILGIGITGYLIFTGKISNDKIIGLLVGGGDVDTMGIVIDDATLGEQAEKHEVLLEGDVEAYCFTCDVAYDGVKTVDVELDSNELSSIVQKVNNRNGVLKNVHIKLGDNNHGAMTAAVDLSSYGIDMSLPVKVEGSFVRDGENIQISIDGAKAGRFPISADMISQGEVYLSNAINDQISRMEGFSIEELSVEGGQMKYKGDFPQTVGTK